MNICIRRPPPIIAETLAFAVHNHAEAANLLIQDQIMVFAGFIRHGDESPVRTLYPSAIVGWAPGIGVGAEETVRMDNVSLRAQPLVLVAEDDAANRDLYGAILDREGIRVIDTNRGSTVVGLARRHRPDVVLLDWRLPELSGEQVLHALKADQELCDIPVIAVTGLAGITVESCKETGFDDVLFKPIRLNVLVDAVRHCLASAEQPAVKSTVTQGPENPARPL